MPGLGDQSGWLSGHRSTAGGWPSFAHTSHHEIGCPRGGWPSFAPHEPPRDRLPQPSRRSKAGHHQILYQEDFTYPSPPLQLIHVSLAFILSGVAASLPQYLTLRHPEAPAFTSGARDPARSSTILAPNTLMKQSSQDPSLGWKKRRVSG